MFRSALFLFLFAPVLCAELRWERPVQEMECTREDRHAIATFSFRNAGNAAVTIRSIKTSCGCTTADLPKKTYLPGESGAVTAKFSFGHRTGLQRKIITVKTEDGVAPALLDLRVMIRERVAVTPALLFWRIGEAPEAKSAQIAIHGGAVQIARVTSSNPRINAALETVAAGEKYALVVRPVDTSRRESAELQIETNFPPDRPRRYAVHVRIK